MHSMRHVFSSVVVGFAFLAVSLVAFAQIPLQFVPVTPCRVADTRLAPGPFGGPALQGQTSRDFAIPESACSIPNTAAAYSLNVAVVPHGGLGYLTVWPAGQTRPVIATLNSVDGRIKANAAIIPAGTNKAISVYATQTTDVILDIDGYFAPADSSTLAFFPLTPCRVADTRRTNGSLGGPYLTGRTERSFPVLSSSCNIPDTAQAYSLNFAAIPHGGLGYMTVWPTGQTRPVVSTLNALTGTVTANAAIVPAGQQGAISVYPSSATDLVIDVDGYFAPANSGPQPLSLYTLSPCRVLDTRPPHGNGSFSGTMPIGVLTSTCLVPSAQAYVLNATVVPLNGQPLGYLTLWPDTESKPVVATLNALDGAITSNMAIVPTLNGFIDAYATSPTNLVADIFSYFAPITALGILNTSLPSGTSHHNYDANLVASGGVPPYTWSVTSGSLPPGLNLDSASGLISGTTTTTGTYPFGVQLADAQSPPDATAPLSITVNATVTQLTVQTTSLLPGTQNTGYIAMLAATGGVTPYTWSITAGALPVGLHLDPNNGTITGTPSGGGTSTFTAAVTDSESPAQESVRQLSITIAPVVPLNITTTSLPSGTAGTAYSSTLTAIGGVYPYTWSITTGSLPIGLNLNANTGAITGTPTTQGTSNLTVQVADSETPPASATAQLSITINLPARIFTVLHNFAGPEGSQPSAPLVLATDGNFYGTDFYGGTGGGGTFFKMTPSGTLTPLYNFCSQHYCADGDAPAGMVQATDGNFYGVTVDGGNNHFVGTAFRLTPSGVLSTLYNFCSVENCPDGQNPVAIMQASDGNLYGLVALGGDNSIGVFYQLTLSGTMTDLYSFDGSTGREPSVKLVQGPDGQMYGTAPYGGANGYGTVFKITLNGTLSRLYSFCSQANCVDGAYPVSGLTLGSDGNFYGTTSGGTATPGTFYKITPNGTLTTLYSFCSQSHCSDGNHPYPGPVQGSDGNFYGTTNSGGANNDGTIYELTPSGTLITLHSFNGTDGINPTVKLVQDSRGYLYGSTYTGGTNNLGVEFSLSPPQ